MKNPERSIPNDGEGRFVQVSDSSSIFIYDYQPVQEYEATIFMISGVTGINHNEEKDIIEQLSDHKNRVVIIHPRGSGYSDGKRGDISNFSLFINDYVEIITNDRDYKKQQPPVILFGHSMSCAILLSIADKIERINGAILVNPPYIQKAAKGMSPSFGDYLKYAWYYVFAKHKPVVNMEGNQDR
ncbi:MAG: alpha/beta fold hydrolase [Bacteroidota bacterium]